MDIPLRRDDLVSASRKQLGRYPTEACARTRDQNRAWHGESIDNLRCGRGFLLPVTSCRYFVRSRTLQAGRKQSACCGLFKEIRRREHNEEVNFHAVRAGTRLDSDICSDEFGQRFAKHTVIAVKQHRRNGRQRPEQRGHDRLHGLQRRLDPAAERSIWNVGQQHGHDGQQLQLWPNRL